MTTEKKESEEPEMESFVAGSGANAIRVLKEEGKDEEDKKGTFEALKLKALQGIEVIGDKVMEKGAAVANQSLDDLCALRTKLNPHGYELQEVGVAMGVPPTVSVNAIVTKDVNLDKLDQEGYTDTQLKVVWALRQKKLLEGVLTRHDMSFSAMRVTCTLPPLLRMEVGWSSPPKPLQPKKPDEAKEMQSPKAQKAKDAASTVVAAASDKVPEKVKELGEAAKVRGGAAVAAASEAWRCGAGDEAIAAVDKGLEELCALRAKLIPFGYMISSINIGLALIPAISCQVLMAKDANLDKLDDSQLTDLQRKVVWAVRQKKVVENSVEAHGMQFVAVSITCSIPPHVKFNLGWQDLVGAEQNASQEKTEKGSEEVEAAGNEKSSGGFLSKAKATAGKAMDKAKTTAEAGAAKASEMKAAAADKVPDKAKTTAEAGAAKASEMKAAVVEKVPDKVLEKGASAADQAKGIANKGIDKAKAAAEVGAAKASEFKAWAVDEAGALGNKALSTGTAATDKALSSISALRNKMYPYGFTLSCVYIGMAMIPQFAVSVLLSETANVDGLNEDDLDDLQRKVVWAVKQKQKVDKSLKKHSMACKAISVTCTVPPSVGLSVGWDFDEATKKAFQDRGGSLSKAAATAETGLDEIMDDA